MTVNVDFATGTCSGTVMLTGTDQRTGRVVALGTFPLTSTTASMMPPNNITANLGPGKNAFRAKLTGMTAEEMEGSFALVLPDPGGMGTLNIVGAAGAHR